MSAPSFSRFLALAGQGQLVSGTESRASPDTQATSSHRPNRLELQAVLARAQARKGYTAQAAVDEVPIVGLGLPAELFPPALRGNVGEVHVSSAPPTPPATPPYLSSPVDDEELYLSFPSPPLNTPAEHMYIPGKTRPSLYAMPAFLQDGGRALIGLGISMGSFPDEPAPTIPESAFPGPRIAPRRIIEDIAADPIVTPGELTRRDFPLTPGAPLRGRAAPGESGRYFPLTPGIPLHTVVTPASEVAVGNFHRTPGAPLCRQPSRGLFDGLLGRWGGAIPMSRGSSMSVEEDQLRGPTPLPTPMELLDVFVF